MKYLKILKPLILISTVFLSTQAMSSEIGPEISLYNIGEGYLAYTYHNGNNEWLGFNNAAYLNGNGYQNRGIWNVIYNANGTISFRNKAQPTLCIEFYGTDSNVVQKTCNTQNENQQFNLVPTSNGALRLKFKSNDQCLYDKDSYIYSKECPNEPNRYFNWAIIPPLQDAF